MNAAEIGLAGMNPITYLTSRDRNLRFAMQEVAKISREHRDHDAEQLAVLIANKVGQLLGG